MNCFQTLENQETTTFLTTLITLFIIIPGFRNSLQDAFLDSHLINIAQLKLGWICIYRFIRVNFEPQRVKHESSCPRNSFTHSFRRGGSYFAEVGNWPIFMAANGNIAYISRISDTKTVMETEISYFRGSENGNCQYNSHGHRKS